MSIRIISTTDPVTAAWNSFDAAATHLQAMYIGPVRATRKERLEQSITVAHAWRRFQDLVTPDEPRPAV